VAVSITNQLPDQPVIGASVYTPLGGDGWSSPHSVAEFSVGSAGDASAGNNAIEVLFDPRFSSLVSYVRLSNSSASTAIEMSLILLPPVRSTPQVQAFANAVPVMGLSTQNNLTWCPPPLPGLGRLQALTPNINGDTLSLMGYIFQFERRALELVPLSVILASLPRGDNMVTVMTSN